MAQVELEHVAGYTAAVEHFGRWPSFHDAEVLQLNLQRCGISVLSVYTWNMLNEVDERGYYKLADHATVHFRMREITHLELSEFNMQNVIFGLSLEQIESAYRISLDPCWGLHGSITCGGLEITFDLGILPEKQPDPLSVAPQAVS